MKLQPQRQAFARVEPRTRTPGRLIDPDGLPDHLTSIGTLCRVLEWSGADVRCAVEAEVIPRPRWMEGFGWCWHTEDVIHQIRANRRAL